MKVPIYLLKENLAKVWQSHVAVVEVGYNVMEGGACSRPDKVGSWIVTMAVISMLVMLVVMIDEQTLELFVRYQHICFACRHASTDCRVVLSNANIGHSTLLIILIDGFVDH